MLPGGMSSRQTVLILDYGAQYTQLIARRVREAQVYCEIHPFQKAEEAFDRLKPKGVIRAIPLFGFHVEPVVWLATRSAAERDHVIEHGIPRDLVIQRLEEAGVRPDLAARAGVTVESEETVEREHGSNWRIAMQ